MIRLYRQAHDKRSGSGVDAWTDLWTSQKAISHMNMAMRHMTCMHTCTQRHSCCETLSFPGCMHMQLATACLEAAAVQTITQLDACCQVASSRQ